MIALQPFYIPQNFVSDATPLLLSDELRSRFENESAPLRHDLVDAADVILRIHFMYSLKAADVRSS